MDNTTTSFGTMLIGLLIRHLAGGIAGWLILHQMIGQSDAVNFEKLFTGIVIGLIVLGWSAVQKKWHVQALNGLTSIIDSLAQAQGKALQSASNPLNPTPTTEK